MRRCVAVLSLMLVAVATAAPAYAQLPGRVERRVVVIVAQHTRVAEWRNDPALAAVAGESALGLISTRTTGTTTRQAALRTLGAGARTRASGDGRALERRLTEHGIPLFTSKTLHQAFGGERIDGVQEGDALPDPSVTVLDAEALPLFAFDGRGLIGDDDLLIVVAPFEGDIDGVRLGVVAMRGAGFGPGILLSPSTRQRGLVTLPDVAPTILSSLGVPADGMAGRVIEHRSSTNAVAAVGSMEQALLEAHRARSPVIRTLLWGAIITVAAATLALVLRPLLIALVAVVWAAALPGLAFVSVAIGMREHVAWWVAGVAAVIAVVLSGVLGARRAIAAIGIVSAAVILIDIASGGPIAARSPMSYLLARGDRFYGIGNEAMGIVIGGAIVGSATLIRISQRVGALVAAALAIAVLLMAAPGAGAKFGATLTAVPVFGYLLARATGVRFSWRLAGVLTGATLASAAVVIAIDRLRPDAVRSHIAGVGGERTWSVLLRKWEAAASLLRFSLWFNALLVLLVCFALLWFLRRSQIVALLDRDPMVSPAVVAAGMAIVFAIAFNDAGVTAAALIAVIVCPWLIAGLYEDVPVPTASRSEPRQPSLPVPSS